MTNVKLKRDSLEMWLILTSVGKDVDLINQMKKDEDGSYQVEFNVGGLELDFNNVVERLDKSLDDLVARKATELLQDKYSDIINDIQDIQDRISHQKERFKYDNES